MVLKEHVLNIFEQSSKQYTDDSRMKRMKYNTVQYEHAKLSAYKKKAAMNVLIRPKKKNATHTISYKVSLKVTSTLIAS